MIKNLFLYAALLWANISFAFSDHYVVCNIRDLDRHKPYPYVATLVISPLVNGEHYFSSFIGGKKEGGITSGIGPMKLQDAVVNEQELKLVFPDLGRADVLQFESIRAKAKNDYFIVYESSRKSDVKILAPKGQRKPPRTTAVECYAVSQERMAHLSSNVDTSRVTIDPDGVQIFNGLSAPQARDFQTVLLYQHLQK